MLNNGTKQDTGYGKLSLLFYEAVGYGKVEAMQRRFLALLLIIAGLWAQVQCWSYTDDFKIEVDTECLEMFPEEINASIAGTGYTMIHWAAENGQTEEVELLISLGADVKVTDFFDNTPLHLIARNNKALSPQLMAQIGKILVGEGSEPAGRLRGGVGCD